MVPDLVQGGLSMSLFDALEKVRGTWSSGLTYTTDPNELVYWSLVDIFFGVVFGSQLQSGKTSMTELFVIVCVWEVINIIYLRTHSKPV
jgi:hypothetical protein